MKKKLFIGSICFVLGTALLASCSAEPAETTAPVPETTQTQAPAETALAPIIATSTPTPEPTPEVDVTAPFFVNINRDAWVALNDEFDINNYVSYIDNMDDEVELIIDGGINTTQTGSYPLNLTIIDDEGNSTSDYVNVTVYEPVDTGSGGDNTGTSTTNATAFADFMAAYPGDNVHYGIDVSKWQGAINWQQVADAGCEFAFIRAGWSSAGEFHEDEYFRTNMEGANAAGITIGVYVYTTDNTPEDITALADHMCDLVSEYQVDLPIVFDWENFFSNFQKYKLSIRSINDLYDIFEEEIQARGYTSMIYGSKFIFDIIWDDDIENVWLAHYTTQTDYTGNYSYWQQSCTGTIPGIDAYVDMDLFYGELP